MQSKRKSGMGCSAIGCSMRTNTNLLSKVKCFRFPKDTVRRAAWCNAMKRENWTPTNNTVVCNAHFVTGMPNSDPQHPDYVPSVFNFKKMSFEDGEKKLKRYERNIKRIKHDSLNMNSDEDNGLVDLKMVKCCVRGCTNHLVEEVAGKVPMSFHKLPRDPTLRQAWISAIRKENFVPGPLTVVCSAHFKPEEFYPPYASGLKKLRENVVPSIFEFSEHYLNPKQEKDRAYNTQTCSCKSLRDNTLEEFPKLKVILPPNYSYYVCEWTDLGHGCFDAVFRVNISSKEAALLWLKEFQITSKSEFNKERTFPGDAIRNIFKVYLKCVHNTKPRSNVKQPHTKHTNCKARLLITVKKTQFSNKYYQSSDFHLPDFPMVVTYRNKHNHELKNSDCDEATTKPILLFLKNAESNDSTSEIAPPIRLISNDSDQDMTEVLKATENIIVDPYIDTVIDDQFEVDYHNSYEDLFSEENKKQTTEGQKNSLYDLDFPQKNKEDTEIQNNNTHELDLKKEQTIEIQKTVTAGLDCPQENKDQTTDIQKTNSPEIDLSQVNKMQTIIIQNFYTIPAQNKSLVETNSTQDSKNKSLVEINSTQDSKEQTLKEFLSFAKMIVDKSRSNNDTFKAVEIFMENMKKMKTDDSINSALVNFGKTSSNLNENKTKFRKLSKKNV